MGMNSDDIDKLYKFILEHGIFNIQHACDNFKREYIYMRKRTIKCNGFWDDNNNEQIKGHKYDFGSPFRYGKYSKTELVREIIEMTRHIQNYEVMPQTPEYVSIFKNGFANKIYSLYQIEKGSYYDADNKISIYDEIPTYSFIDKTYQDKTLKQSLIEKYILCCKLIKFLYQKREQKIALFTKCNSRLTNNGYNVINKELIPLLYKEVDSSFVLYELLLKIFIDSVCKFYDNFYQMALYGKNVGNEYLPINIDTIIDMTAEIRNNICFLYTHIDKALNNSKVAALGVVPFKLTEAEKLYLETKLIIYRYINNCHMEAFSVFMNVIDKYNVVERESYNDVLNIPDNKVIDIVNDVKIKKAYGYIFHYYRRFWSDYFVKPKARDLKTPFMCTIQWIRWQYGNNMTTFKLKYFLLYLRIFLFIRKEIKGFDIFHVLGQLKKKYNQTIDSETINISERDRYLLNLVSIFVWKSTSPGIDNLAKTYYTGIKAENEIKKILFKDIYTYLYAVPYLMDFIPYMTILEEAFVQFYRNTMLREK
ncbi:hypothetical protein [Pectinatus frisingensis]|uniref:hypothetical protein n=1 Tax=Pectinatus frisingensis TaxID=865 RepID=UPI0018C7A1E6|nr:hypothetical protein [Pectinatus frisingensis]